MLMKQSCYKYSLEKILELYDLNLLKRVLEPLLQVDMLWIYLFFNLQNLFHFHSARRASNNWIHPEASDNCNGIWPFYSPPNIFNKFTHVCSLSSSSYISSTRRICSLNVGAKNLSTKYRIKPVYPIVSELVWVLLKCQQYFIWFLLLKHDTNYIHLCYFR